MKIAYDERNVYFVIHCFDNEPAKIRTTTSKRDSAFNDDWIAIVDSEVGSRICAH